jgi:hypothetical protein
MTMNDTLLRPLALFVALLCCSRPGVVWAEPAPPEGEDVLGEIVVEATRDESKRIRLPPLVVRPATGASVEAIALHGLITRDLELSGMFELDASLGEPAADDVRPRVTVSAVDSELGVPKLVARVERWRDGAWSAETLEQAAAGPRDRAAAHRLTDRVLGALTGREGSFSGHLAVVRRSEGSDPRLYRADPDGRGLEVITPASQMVVATAFQPGGVLFHAAATNNGAIRLYRSGSPEPLTVSPRGSIYGVGFNALGRVALAIAQGPRIEVWTGPSLESLTRLRAGSLDMQPVVGPDGRVAFTAEIKGTTRIFVGTRPVTPGRASSPAWCDHPDGARLVWIERSSKSSWVWSRRLGQPARQLLAVRGKLSALACSPDGRVLAFSYDSGRALEGPGVYLGNIDVLRPRRVLSHPARALAWGPPTD